MYKFPKDFDGREFVGRILEMICLNANQVYLHFGQKTSICIEIPFYYNRDFPHGDLVTISIPPTSVDFLELLECRVEDVKVSNERCLTLIFDSGKSLSFIADKEPYESYKLVFGDKIIVV